MHDYIGEAGRVQSSCSSSRLVALQIWPLVQKQPNMTHSTVLRTSHPGNTIAGDLPPSSSVHLATWPACHGIAEH